MQSLYKAIVIRRQMGDIKEVKMKKVPRKSLKIQPDYANFGQELPTLSGNH